MIDKVKLKIFEPDIVGCVGSVKLIYTFKFNVLDEQKKITEGFIRIIFSNSLTGLMTNDSQTPTDKEILFKTIAYQEALNEIINKIRSNRLKELTIKEEQGNTTPYKIELDSRNKKELMRYVPEEIDLDCGIYKEIIISDKVQIINPE